MEPGQKVVKRFFQQQRSSDSHLPSFDQLTLIKEVRKPSESFYISRRKKEGANLMNVAAGRIYSRLFDLVPWWKQAMKKKIVFSLKENFPEDGSLAVEINWIINLAKQTNRSFSIQTQLILCKKIIFLLKRLLNLSTILTKLHQTRAFHMEYPSNLMSFWQRIKLKFHFRPKKKYHPAQNKEAKKQQHHHRIKKKSKFYCKTSTNI
jgi:hypothetical protein